MRKLKIEELAVDSFETTNGIPGTGTVVAHSGCSVCGVPTAQGYITCADWTCVGVNCTQGPGASALCGGTGEGSGCCHPYDISLDWTFCDTECCNSDAYTCHPICG